MKEIVVLGASGIIGQHMRLCVPPGVKARYFRRVADDLHEGLDLNGVRPGDLRIFRGIHALVNLAGESSTDVVEKDPDSVHWVNVVAPDILAAAADMHNFHYVHVSSQAVFSGDEPPYGPVDHKSPVNAYGDQKLRAEALVMSHRNFSIVRPTFVLGIRPFPFMGRANPLEMMFRPGPQKQVMDRYFSPCFARDAAMVLWTVALMKGERRVFHVGSPSTTSRYSLAVAMREIGRVKHGMNLAIEDVTPVLHESFEGAAPRPINTTYKSDGIITFVDFAREAERSAELLEAFMTLGIADRARELSLFLGIGEEQALHRLEQGFIPLHHAVAADFKAAGVDQTNAAQLLAWYQATETYIWELSAYHLDPFFNYAGMCEGIVTHLKNHLGPMAPPDLGGVLALGDGIGDLTLALEQGIGRGAGVYHDLAGSATASFAMFRLERHLGYRVATALTADWSPPQEREKYDAIIAVDFFEHVPNVEEWVRACFGALKPGGLFFAQNAFAMGDAEHGDSIPMHLSANNRYVEEWDPLLEAVGFERRDTSNWRRRPDAA